MINAFIEKVDAAEAVDEREGFVTLETLQNELSTDAWISLTDPLSPVNKLLKSSLFVTS